MMSLLPCVFDLGRVYVGAIVEGVFLIEGIDQVKDIIEETEYNDIKPFRISVVKVSGVEKRSDKCFKVTFSIVCKTIGSFRSILRIVAQDCCEAQVLITGHIARISQGLNIAFCSSAFRPMIHSVEQSLFVRAMDAVPARVHHLVQLENILAENMDTLVLSDMGLRETISNPDIRDAIIQKVKNGMGLICFAGIHHLGACEAANNLLKPFGIVYDTCKRVVEPMILDSMQIQKISITEGINSLYWYPANAVSFNANNIACVINGRSKDSSMMSILSICTAPAILAFGLPSWANLLAAGYPYDNIRLLINALVASPKEWAKVP